VYYLLFTVTETEAHAVYYSQVSFSMTMCSLPCSLRWKVFIIIIIIIKGIYIAQVRKGHKCAGIVATVILPAVAENSDAGVMEQLH